MKQRPEFALPSLLATLAAVLLFAGIPVRAQDNSRERTFPQSKTAVEQALKELQPSMSGRLPALEGFAAAGPHPLDRYQRAFYQCATQVSPTANGSVRVRVTAKVTAWYADSFPSRSGYQLLTSNGRIETDLLDQLQERLDRTAAKTSPAALADHAAPGASNLPAPFPALGASMPSAPMPNTRDSANKFLPSSSPTVAASLQASSRPAQNLASDRPPSTLRAEAQSLEEILKNQSHPNNLVAVKKSGTPVVASPSLTAKALFMASQHDEFEMLDYNADWVHVRVSGLSRGWIWRTSVEMPGDIPDVDALAAAAPLPSAEDLFHVTREETAPFPGDWDPLRGKSVKIISVQQTGENPHDSGPQVKLEFAKSLLNKNYTELAQKAQNLSGIVLIFDAADGGMMATTLSALRQWKAGALSDSALWHRCYFDPPETFGASGSSASQ